MAVRLKRYLSSPYRVELSPPPNDCDEGGTGLHKAVNSLSQICYCCEIWTFISKSRTNLTLHNIQWSSQMIENILSFRKTKYFISKACARSLCGACNELLVSSDKIPMETCCSILLLHFWINQTRMVRFSKAKYKAEFSYCIKTDSQKPKYFIYGPRKSATFSYS